MNLAGDGLWLTKSLGARERGKGVDDKYDKKPNSGSGQACEYFVLNLCGVIPYWAHIVTCFGNILTSCLQKDK